MPLPREHDGRDARTAARTAAARMKAPTYACVHGETHPAIDLSGRWSAERVNPAAETAMLRAHAPHRADPLHYLMGLDARLALRLPICPTYVERYTTRVSQL